MRVYDPVMEVGKEEWKGASLSKQRKGARFRSPAITQGIEAALEGVVPALRTLTCRCSKHPTYVSESSLLSGEIGDPRRDYYRLEGGEGRCAQIQEIKVKCKGLGDRAGKGADGVRCQEDTRVSNLYGWRQWGHSLSPLVPGARSYFRVFI